MEVVAYFFWQKSGGYSSDKWHDPATALSVLKKFLTQMTRISLGHFGQAVAEGVDDEFEPV